LSSLRSYGAAIVSSQCSPVSASKALAGRGCRFVTGAFLAPGRLQPFDIVEAALDVAALGIGLALVAEERPDFLLVIKAGHKPASHLLEEGAILDIAQDGDALFLPAKPQIASGSGPLVQIG